MRKTIAVIKILKGMGPTKPLPKKVKFFPNPKWILAPSVITQAIPLTEYIVPKVAMMEGTFITTTKKPLRSPIREPIKIEATIERGKGNPLVTKIADRVPEIAIIDPIERSKLPEIIKRVTAHPAKITAAVCRKTLVMLLYVKNSGVRMVNTIKRTNNTPTIINFCNLVLSFTR
jgi:hypothetical protein